MSRSWRDWIAPAAVALGLFAGYRFAFLPLMCALGRWLYPWL